MLALVTILPMGKGGSLAKPIAEALEIIDQSGLDYRVTAMGTIIEGEWDPVMKLIKKVRDRMMKSSDRVYLTIAVDDRKDRRRRIEEKVRSVEHVLGKSLRK